MVANFSGNSPRAKARCYKDTISPERRPTLRSIGASPDDETPGRVRACGAGEATHEARRRSSSSEGSMPRANSNFPGKFSSGEGSMLRSHDSPGVAPFFVASGLPTMTKRPGGSRHAGRGRRGATLADVRHRAKARCHGRIRILPGDSSSSEGSMLRSHLLGRSPASLWHRGFPDDMGPTRLSDFVRELPLRRGGRGESRARCSGGGSGDR